MKIVQEEIVDALMGLECIEFEGCSFQVGEDMGAHWFWCLSLGPVITLLPAFLVKEFVLWHSATTGHFSAPRFPFRLQNCSCSSAYWFVDGK